MRARPSLLRLPRVVFLEDLDERLDERPLDRLVLLAALRLDPLPGGVAGRAAEADQVDLAVDEIRHFAERDRSRDPVLDASIVRHLGELRGVLQAVEVAVALLRELLE